MCAVFLTPRFAGTRFDGHTLPIEVAKDLAAYEELIVDLAKHLYLKDNPTRKRVPKGFDDEFSLHVKQVDDGSAKPVLLWAAAFAGILASPPEHASYFERARLLVGETVSAEAAGMPIPDDFPLSHLAAFNQLGRSLRDGESVDLAPAGSAIAELTPERRKQLVLKANSEYTKDIDICGQIDEVDYRELTFRLRSEGGETIRAKFQPADKAVVHRAAGDSVRRFVRIKGSAVLDAQERHRKPVEMSHIEELPNQPLAKAISNLSELRAGWFEGQGVAIPADKLAELSDLLANTFPEDLVYPFVAATPYGDVFLEWISDERRVSAEIIVSDKSCSLQCVKVRAGESIEAEVSLDDPQGVESFYNFIRVNA